MKIKYLQTLSGDNFNINALLEDEFRSEYLTIRNKFIKEKEVLKPKDTFQMVKSLFLFHNCFYINDNKGITQASQEDFTKKIIKYDDGFSQGYKDTFSNNSYSENMFKIIKGEFKLLFALPKEYYGERYLLLDKPSTNRETFFDNKGQLTEYCNLCFYTHGYRVGEFIARWDAILNHHVNGVDKEVSLPKKVELKKETKANVSNFKNKELVSLFEHTSKYKKVLDILVSKHKTDEITYLWIDLNNGHKKELASLIFHLQIKGYYKNNKKPSDNEVKEICQNTFGVDVGISTVNHSKATYFDFNYIPYASTLDNNDN